MQQTSYVEYRRLEPVIHKTLIIPLGCIMAPHWVGPPDRGYGADRTSALRSSRKFGTAQVHHLWAALAETGCLEGHFLSFPDFLIDRAGAICYPRELWLLPPAGDPLWI